MNSSPGNIYIGHDEAWEKVGKMASGNINMTFTAKIDDRALTVLTGEEVVSSETEELQYQLECANDNLEFLRTQLHLILECPNRISDEDLVTEIGKLKEAYETRKDQDW